MSGPRGAGRPESTLQRHPTAVALATTLALAATSLAVAVAPGSRAQWGWEAAKTWAEPWRLVTCHFVHLGPQHVAANLGALALLAWVGMRREAGISFALGALVAAAAVSAGLAANLVPLDWYVGLSGMLYGVFAHESLRLAEPSAWRRRLGFVLYLGGLAKVIADLRLGVGSVGALGIPVAPPAHLYGYLGGTLAALPALLRPRRGAPG